MPEPFSNGSTAVASLQNLKEEVSGEKKPVRTVVLLAGPCTHCKLAHTTPLYVGASANLANSNSNLYDYVQVFDLGLWFADCECKLLKCGCSVCASLHL